MIARVTINVEPLFQTKKVTRVMKPMRVDRWLLVVDDFPMVALAK